MLIAVLQVRYVSAEQVWSIRCAEQLRDLLADCGWQLGRILKWSPKHLRTEVLCVMWGRLVDEENSKQAFGKLSPAQYLDCFKRSSCM